MKQELRAQYERFLGIFSDNPFFKKIESTFPYVLGAIVLWMSWVIFDGIYNNSESKRKARYLNAA